MANDSCLEPNRSHAIGCIVIEIPPLPHRRKRRRGLPRLNVSSSAVRAIQICPNPPSTLISTPVMYDASCEAKNATVAATSSGCPNRFIGTFATISFANSSMASLRQPGPPKDRRDNRPRRNRVHADAAPHQFRRRSSRQRAQRGFRCRIRAGSRVACAVRHAGIQDDRRAVIQERQRFLDGEVRSLDVDVKLLVVKRFRTSRQAARTSRLPRSRTTHQSCPTSAKPPHTTCPRP